MSSDYRLEEKTQSGFCMITVLRCGVFQRRASGDDRESAIARLKTQLDWAVEEGRKAQEIRDFLAENEKESVERVA